MILDPPPARPRPAALRRLAALGLLVIATATLAPVAGQASDAPGRSPEAAGAVPADPAAPLALDPAVRAGTLPNGLRYFIRRNLKPEKRAELWLAVNAGSILEDDDQRGLAHFIEHMAFNGTRRFEKHEIVDRLERMGMRFGPDVNASTSFDETLYTLTVPTDDPALVVTAFDILEDWAGGVAFDAQEVDRERGVVLEEWRLGRGAGARIRDKQFPVLMHGSRYAERLPIGDPEILKGAPREALLRFYRDWYRPDLMAVIAVGDFDPQVIEKQIRKRFKRLHGPREPRPRQSFPVPGHEETLVAVTADPEATGTSVQMRTLAPKTTLRSAADLRRDLIARLHHAILNERLDEIRRRPDPPFLSAFSSSGGLVRTSDAVSRSAGVPEGGIVRGLEALLTEVERVGRHGLSQGELDRAKAVLLRGYERAFEERDKQQSSAFASEYASLFLEEEAAPGIERELALVREFLPGISLAEVDGLSRDWAADRDRVILASGPEKKDAPLPGREALLAVFRDVRGRDIAPWVDDVHAGPLLPAPPAPGTIVEESRYEGIGATRWKLSNGVVVVLKPTDFKNDEILLSGSSPGGTSLVPDDRFLAASLASGILREGGLGQFTLPQLRKALAGKVANATALLSELDERLVGNASPRDLRTMFELLYLSATSPRADAAAFESWRARTEESLRNRLASPAAVFGDRMNEALSQGHLRRRPLTVEALQGVRLEDASAAFAERFADLGDFTFVIVGSFQPDEIRPLVLQYLGGLPSSGRVESWRDVGVRPPEGVVRVEERKGIEPKSQVRIVFTGETAWSREASHDIDALGDALSIRLREVLREDLGGTYGVQASGGIAREPRERFSFSVSFGCAPESVEKLIAAAFAEMEAFRKDGPPEEVVAKVRETERREREVRLQENSFWLGEIAERLRYQEDPDGILRDGELIERTARDRVRDAARRFLDPGRYVQGVLYPDAAPMAAPAGGGD